LVPSHNYALAASILFKMINTDAEIIKQWAILDSGATSHFLMTNAPATNILPTAVPIVARVPNGNLVHSMHVSMLIIPSLPPNAHAAHIILGLTSQSLLSIMTMCNAGCTVILTKIGCTIVYCGQTIVCSHKCIRTVLWIIPLTPWSPSAPAALSAANLPSIAMATNVDATSSSTEYACYVHQLL
jgi:hypothetical protein